VIHPHRLFELLTADQFLDWWAAYCVSPWGPERSDLRSAAAVAMAAGARGVSPTWPYLETLEGIEAEYVAIAERHGIDPDIIRRKLHHARNRGHDPNSA